MAELRTKYNGQLVSVRVDGGAINHVADDDGRQHVGIRSVIE